MFDRDLCYKIVFLYYGSLTDFSSQHMTVAEVSKELRLAWTSVKTLLIRFRSSGYDFERMLNTKRGRFTEIPANLKSTLVKPSLL